LTSPPEPSHHVPRCLRHPISTNFATRPKQGPEQRNEFRVESPDFARFIPVGILFGPAMQPDDLALVEDVELGAIAGAPVDLMDMPDVRPSFL
jgi:hypothetical protein